MPKELKKRGRREEKKRKRDGDDPGSLTIPKRQKSQEEEDDEKIVLDVAEPFQEQSYNDTTQMEDTPFFGLLDEEEQTYFKRANSLLELDQFADAEERGLFLANVYREASGKELKVACSQSCSRLMERLIRLSTPRQLKVLFHRFSGHFLHLVQHRFASHVCEALFLKAAPTVTHELIALEEEEQEPGKDEDAPIAMKDLFVSTVKELEGNLGYLMTDSFASHTLRVLLVVLSGQPLTGTATNLLLQSKKKEKVASTARTIGATAEALGPRTVPEEFTAAMDRTIAGTVAGLNTTYLQALATHPTGNPVLQLLLELEFARLAKSKAGDEISLFRRLLPDDPPVEGTSSAIFIRGLLYDPVGSRLLETIIQFAPGKIFKTLYKSMFRDKIGDLVRNETAGFVVIRILERLSHDDLQPAIEQICPHIPMLIERQRISIIKVTIERCTIRQVDTQTIGDAIKIGYGEAQPDMLLHILKLGRDETEGMAEERKAQLEAQDLGKLHGSLLAQSMVQAPGPLREVILNNILAMDLQSLMLMAKDRTATHLLQSVLTCSGQTKQFRRKMIQQFFGYIAELAFNPIASHVVDTFWAATEDLLYLRERIAEELQQAEAALRDSFSGRAVWRNWMMDLYTRKRVDWISKAKGLQQVDERPKVQGKHEQHIPVKSGIELARERFATTKTGKQARGRTGRSGIGTGANVVPSSAQPHAIGANT
ncbi:Nucleolar protein 9 [Ptychographa xylographoides]|nr:Nucleolar protein 9 [Ptychographa xylographoides]